jgi:hypothetical protein
VITTDCSELIKDDDDDDETSVAEAASWILPNLKRPGEALIKGTTH